MIVENIGTSGHLCCVGLSGSTEECVGKLTKWSCPDCFFSPHCKKFLGAGISKSSVGSDCGTVRDESNIKSRAEYHSASNCSYSSRCSA